MMSADAYVRMLFRLLPPSRLWRRDDGGILWKIFRGSADELERVDTRAEDLIRESDPSQTEELLPEFEKLLALASEGTLEARRARVLSTLIIGPRYRPVDFQTTLAPVLGLAAEDVVVIERDRAFAILVDDDREIFRFFVYRDPSAPGTYDLAAAQVIIDGMKPSHTAGYVIESVSLLCDDPYSLCDRDLLGI